MGSGLLAKNGLLWLFTQGRWKANKDGLDFFWGVNFILPKVHANIRILTIHDLVFKLHPSTMKRLHRISLVTTIKRSIANAHVVVSISNVTSADLVKYYGVSSTLIKPSVDGEQFRHLKVEQMDAFRKRMNLDFEYFLIVGTIEPRKNLPWFIEQFMRYYTGTTRLVIVGKSGWRNDKSQKVINEHQKTGRINYFSYIGSDALPVFYNCAKGFIAPSLYEGFGMTILEALACGCPVFASNIPAHREAGGDACTYFDLRNDSVAEMLRNIDTVSGAKNRKGYYETWTWFAAAEKFLNLLETTFLENSKNNKIRDPLFKGALNQ